MKLAELRVREEITGILLARVKIRCNYEWITIGEAQVEAKMIGGIIIINCYYNSMKFIQLTISGETLIQFKVLPVERGLMQMRWFLEQIKKR